MRGFWASGEHGGRPSRQPGERLRRPGPIRRPRAGRSPQIEMLPALQARSPQSCHSNGCRRARSLIAKSILVSRNWDRLGGDRVRAGAGRAKSLGYQEWADWRIGEIGVGYGKHEIRMKVRNKANSVVPVSATARGGSLTLNQRDSERIRMESEKLPYSRKQRSGPISGVPRQAQGRGRRRGSGRSSMNALKHGLTGTIALLPDEDREPFDMSLRGWMAELKPRTVAEHQRADARFIARCNLCGWSFAA